MERWHTLFITDSRLADEEHLAKVPELAARAAEGSWAVLLRDKTRESSEIREFGLRLRDAVALSGGGLIVADRVELANDIEADGVHLSRGNLVRAGDASRLGWTSCSIHEPEEAKLALELGIENLLVGPIFAVPGKSRGKGLELLSRVRSEAPGATLYALGGVNLERSQECLDAGANGIACVRSAWV